MIPDDYSIETQGGILIISLEGRLDTRGAIELDEFLKGHIRETDRSVVFDMRDLPYLSSAGIRTILAAEKSMRGRGGGIHLAGLQPYPLSVLEMTGFVSLLSLHASCDDAIRAARAVVAVDGPEGSEAPVPFHTRGAEYRVTRIGSGETTLSITGHPSARDGLAVPVTVSTSACSLGRGAPGRKADEPMGPGGDLLTVENIAVPRESIPAP